MQKGGINKPDHTLVKVAGLPVSLFRGFLFQKHNLPRHHLLANFETDEVDAAGDLRGD
ncbi:MAG: hypothetical protein JSW58_05960 [Candidatus Latescibacterota bacterium]|nr:MAG: hypothetical protein JSW58_05960 [Candidatus Latescibacterota bacterium]